MAIFCISQYIILRNLRTVFIQSKPFSILFRRAVLGSCCTIFSTTSRSPVPVAWGVRDCATATASEPIIGSLFMENLERSQTSSPSNISRNHRTGSCDGSVPPTDDYHPIECRIISNLAFSNFSGGIDDLHLMHTCCQRGHPSLRGRHLLQ